MKPIRWTSVRIRLTFWNAILLALLLVGFIAFIVVINFFSVWIRALFSGARVTFTELIALRLRKVPVGLIVDSRITAVKSGLDVTIDDPKAYTEHLK